MVIGSLEATVQVCMIRSPLDDWTTDNSRFPSATADTSDAPVPPFMGVSVLVRLAITASVPLVSLLRWRDRVSWTERRLGLSSQARGLDGGLPLVDHAAAGSS